MRSWIAAGTLTLFLAAGFALPAEAQRHSSSRGNGYAYGNARPRNGGSYGYNRGSGYSRGYGYNRGSGYGRGGYGRGYSYNGGYRRYGYGGGYGHVHGGHGGYGSRYGYAPYRYAYGYSPLYGYVSFGNVPYYQPYYPYAYPYAYAPPAPAYYYPFAGYVGPQFGVTFGFGLR